MISTDIVEILAGCILGGMVLVMVAWVVVRLRRSPFTPAQALLYGLNYLIVRIVWRTEIGGRVSLPPGEGAVIVCNHRCPLDPSFIAPIAGRVVHWMVAREYVEHPILGWLLRTCEVIPVNRGGIDTAATKLAIRYAREGGLVALFPEGRINVTDRLLLPGRAGAAMIALKARVPVVPCYVHGAPYDGTPLGCVLMPAKVRLTVGRPIDVSEYAGRENDRQGLEDLTKRILVEIARLAGQADFQPELAGRWPARDLENDQEALASGES
ncbi:MAG TPA: lysophospholipid acyltransferase family protein [Thermoguttaceae bacterium]|nr:lysophospholipid acyltransferase family protein [Thermoguttaceae bacterium]